MPTHTHKNQKPLSFEQVWQMFQELKEQMLRSSAELDKRFVETDLKYREEQMALDKAFREEQARSDRNFKKRIRKLDTLFTGQWGKLIESLTEGRLLPLLNSRGINVTQTFENATDDAHLMEFDIIADNGLESVVVEVKTTLKNDDVDYFLEKLDRFKEVFHSFSSRKVYGAVAFLKAQPNVRKYAEKKGLLVIKVTGAGRILNATDFLPKVW